MNKFTILTTIAAMFVAAPATVAQISPVVNEISKYVYPANRPASPPNFMYAPDGNGYLMLSDDHKTVDRYDISTGKKIETLFDATHTREVTLPDIEGFTISDNGRYLLVYRDSEMIYRRSFTASYYVYEIRTRLLKPLSYEFDRQQSPIFSPNGRMVAFVANNNIYIKKNDYDSQVAVTTDGERNKVINGVPDWVYEEEFSTSCSMAFSPDDLTFSYIKYNENDVSLYTLPIYQGTCQPLDEYALYPGTYTYKYPVAGTANSRVSVHTYDIETRKTKDINLPDRNIEYIPRIAYGASPDRLMISTLNRDQNRFEIYCADPRSTVVKSVYTDNVSGGWIEEASYCDIWYGEDSFAVMSGKSGYNHYYQYTYAGAQIKPLTSGEYDVTAFYGFDNKGNRYYQVAMPTPLDRTVCRIDAKGVLTTISQKSGTSSASFSPDMSVAVMSYSDVQTPPQYTLCNADGRRVRSLQDNSAYAARYKDIVKKEFFTMQSEGYTLNGYILKPSDASATNKRPAVMFQYSGPGSQQVLNKWGVDWEQYFVKKGYVVVCVDGRGTGGRGREFMQTVYKRLGYCETIDQVNAAKYAATLPYVDAKRIGICGWSYGGYETLMAASAIDAPYKAAVAIAPVTDWRYYDTIYAERFMLTPQQNETGYKQSAPLSYANRLSCRTLIMYGTADDNVHPVNSLQYVSTLQSMGGFCDMFVFPNMNHSINHCNARAVVYGRMFDFFEHNL